MSYEVFARKYRPQTFDDVVGQEHITRTLRNAIEQNRLAHAYIFVGPRGTGKTSTARILAKSLNCQQSDRPTIHPCGVCDACREIAAGNSLDVLEFDAASNTQVDKVRDLIIDNVKYAPTHGRYKVYLVDEVHMLSTNSFNALLKTLEEPPAHVKFIFATTDVQKVPTTILSRCQRFDLKRIPPGLIAAHLLTIAQKEKIVLAPVAAEAIARGAEGGMRDAESMLDQLVAFCGEKIEEQDVLSVFGLTAQETVARLCGAIVEGAVAEALSIIHEQAEEGRDLTRLLSDLIAHLRNLLVAQADPKGLSGELSAEAVAVLVADAARVPVDKLLELIEQLGAAEGRMRWAPNRKMHLEIAVIRGVQTLRQATLDEVLSTLTAMREGKPAPASSTPAAPAPKRNPPAEKPVPAAAAPAKPTPPPAKQPAAMPILRPEETTVSPPLVEEEPISASEQDETPAPVMQPSPAEIWARLLAEVQLRRPLIRPWVESGRLETIANGKAIIVFPKEQSISADYLQQPPHRQLLEEIFTEITGRPVSLKVELRAGLAPVSVAPAKAVEPSPEEFRNDPLIRKALELFRAEIQPA